MLKNKNLVNMLLEHGIFKSVVETHDKVLDILKSGIVLSNNMVCYDVREHSVILIGDDEGALPVDVIHAFAGKLICQIVINDGGFFETKFYCPIKLNGTKRPAIINADEIDELDKELGFIIESNYVQSFSLGFYLQHAGKDPHQEVDDCTYYIVKDYANALVTNETRFERNDTSIIIKTVNGVINRCKINFSILKNYSSMIYRLYSNKLLKYEKSVANLSGYDYDKAEELINAFDEVEELVEVPAKDGE